MSEFVTIEKKIQACQFLSHDDPFELEGVDLIRMEGVGGYQGKLAYLKGADGNLIPVRPKDYVAVIDGQIKVMIDREFEKNYQPVATKKTKSLTMPPKSGRNGGNRDNAA